MLGIPNPFSHSLHAFLSPAITTVFGAVILSVLSRERSAYRYDERYARFLNECFATMIEKLLEMITSAVRLARQYAKQLEAIGLLFILSAAYFQFQADAAHRAWLIYLVETAQYETEFTRQRVLEALECMQDGDCREHDFSPIMAEAGTFADNMFSDPEPQWRWRRKTLFILGALLVAVGKFADWPKPKQPHKTKR